MFLRGLDTRAAGGNDPEGTKRFVGHFQGDAFEKHRHTLKNYVYSNGPEPSVASGKHYAFGFNHPGRDRDMAEAGESSETRPKNVVVNFIIKY